MPLLYNYLESATCCLFNASCDWDPGGATAPPWMDSRNCDDRAAFKFFYNLFISLRIGTYREASHECVPFGFSGFYPRPVKEFPQRGQHTGYHSAH